MADSRRGAWFDRLALKSLPGWAGSLQRRQLATRCSLPVDEEGPADESELTDLREVYGDWTKEDARD